MEELGGTIRNWGILEELGRAQRSLRKPRGALRNSKEIRFKEKYSISLTQNSLAPELLV